MSSASNSVMQINGNAENMPMNTLMYRNEELRSHKDEHAELAFVETIVGRRGSLRGILALSRSGCAHKYDSSDRG